MKPEMKNMVEEWESKLNNFTTETVEEKRKTIEKNKKVGRKTNKPDEILLEDPKNKEDEDKENSVNFLSSNLQRNSQPKNLKKKNRITHKNDEFIDDEDDMDEEEDNEMEIEHDDSVVLEKTNRKNIEGSSSLRERPKRNLSRKAYVMEIEEDENHEEEEEEEEEYVE